MSILTGIVKRLRGSALVPTADELRREVSEAYGRAASRPWGRHCFPVGRAFALNVGYPPSLLSAIPRAAVRSFAGVSNVSVFAEIPEGSRVLDLGCGAGLDVIVASRRTGPRGQVTAVDFSARMARAARMAVARAGCSNVTVVEGAAEEIPLPDGSVDVALANGIFNLNPHRERIFSELFRVLAPGGSAWVAELVLVRPMQETGPCSMRDWFA